MSFQVETVVSRTAITPAPPTMAANMTDNVTDIVNTTVAAMVTTGAGENMSTTTMSTTTGCFFVT